MRDTPSAGSMTRADILAGEIADSIIDGTLPPGSRLDEHMLAERYGTSRTPVREAIRQLKTTGLIDVRPRRGAVVAEVTSRDLETLFVAMAEIEATCARLCALGMNPVERRRLQALHQSTRDLVEAGDQTAYAAANISLHLQIYAGAHNPVLSDFAAGLRRRLAPFRNAQFRAPGRLPLSFAEHDVIVEAILAGNAAAAHAAMLHHVSLVEDAFEQVARSSSAA
ncbi:GntR family transcriptional regulator [Methylobrevis pamukkalensis]|uniref:HTH-type transcriptional regulator McbR n=1 Tax=Methylobrevis pamukkalensis TaxID=1439726 RepID=A0A1E3H647_9HYPH|nr:GntR family transcriptional regulator [Methylobrevis pamukkalensis]ODN71792.1 HTH-type transcriptional regulator McbR [Methylobrevis pamukkalensis]